MTSASPASGDAAAEFAVLESAIIDHLFELSPSYAGFLGLHEYDGRTPELTRPATDRWVEGARRLLDRLSGLPGASLSRDTAARRILIASSV